MVARSDRELAWSSDLTLSSGPGKELRAQASLVGPGRAGISLLDRQSQGSVRPEGFPLGSPRPGLCNSKTLSNRGGNLVGQETAEMWEQNFPLLLCHVTQGRDTLRALPPLCPVSPCEDLVTDDCHAGLAPSWCWVEVSGGGGQLPVITNQGSPREQRA